MCLLSTSLIPERKRHLPERACVPRTVYSLKFAGCSDALDKPRTTQPGGRTTMRTTFFLIASAVIAGVSSIGAPAQAQWSDYGYNGTLVRCESRDGRTERCSANGGDIQLVRQLSDNACIRGRNWGTDSRGIWVSSGCRAEFRVGYGRPGDDGNDRYGSGYGGNGGYSSNDGLFRCESRDGRTERCGNQYGARVQFIRQLSDTPCVRGRSWGSDSRGVWVSNGCRGLFQATGRYGNNNGSYGNDLVRCESRDNRSRTCAIPSGRNSDIRLLRQLSDTPCIENKTWGRSRAGVWVTRGCRAEFVVGRGGGRWEDGRHNDGRRDDQRRPPGDLGDDRPPGG